MENVVGFIIFMAVMIVVDWYFRRRDVRSGRDLERSADRALRSHRHLARRRAKAASVPVPIYSRDDTSPTPVIALRPRGLSASEYNHTTTARQRKI